MRPYPLYLAPMEDVTDPAFRLLCKRFGADRVYTEFINCDALVRSVNRTMQKLTISEKERPVAIQLYGKDPETMAWAARIAEEAEPDFIDLNFGCPVKKVAGKGAGAGLLKDIPRLLQITEAVVKAVRTPVTVKTRLGWDEQNIIIGDLALRLQDLGVREISIHGRTRCQMYKGEADWTEIGKIKHNPLIHIPINGNGDITAPEGARTAFDTYGVDAIMIGRATFGRPWIFREIKYFLETGEKMPAMPVKEQIDILKEHVDNSIEWLQDERKGIVHSRRHFAASPVFKGIANFKPMRIQLLREEKRDNLFALMDEIATLITQNEG